MNNRPPGCSGFYFALLPYRFTLELFTVSLKKIVRAFVGFGYLNFVTFVCIFVDKIDNQLKILWLSTFIDKLNLSIDNYRQISSTIDLSTTHVTSWKKETLWHPGYNWCGAFIEINIVQICLNWPHFQSNNSTYQIIETMTCIYCK